MTTYVKDPITIIQTAGETYIGADAGEDNTYIIAPGDFVAAGDMISIIDNEGEANTIQLVGGLEIASTIIAHDEAVITLSNGAIIDIRGADDFNFDVGGQIGVGGEVKTYAEFVAQDLGLDKPGEGEPYSQGEGVVISDYGTAPVAEDDVNALEVVQGESVGISAASLLANDSDADGDDLTITAIGEVTGGTAVLSEDGETITFTADADFTGPASFVYTVSDGTRTDTATVTGTVIDDGYTNVDIAAGTPAAGTEGVAERFIYEIDSSTGAVLSAEGADIELTGFTIGEDLLLFEDVEAGTTTTETFTDDITVSASAIFNTVDLIFDADANGVGYKLSLAGIGDLAEVDFIVG